MFYLNAPSGGGGETTFPLAQRPGGGEARVLATPQGNLLGDAGALAANAVQHAGMPECARGLRVQPFAGGGAFLVPHFFREDKNKHQTQSRTRTGTCYRVDHTRGSMV